MIIEKIALKGFISYIDEEVDFRKSHTVLVSGNNGEGKSALLDAIPFCFWGIGRGKTLSDYINDSCDTLWIQIIFLMDGIRYKKVRQHGKSGNINELYVDKNSAERLEESSWRLISDDTQRKTDELLSNILGLNYNIFSNSVFFGQKEESSFIEGEASDRKELLCNLLGSQIFEQAEEVTKNFVRDADNKIQSKLIVLNEKIQLSQQYQVTKSSVDNTLKKIADCKSNVKKLQEQLIVCQNKKEKTTADLSKQEHNKKQLIDINVQINDFKRQFDQLKKDLDEKNENLESTIDEGIEAVESLQKTIDQESDFQDQKLKHEETLKSITIEKAKLPVIKEKLNSFRHDKEKLIQRQTEIDTNIKVFSERKMKINKAGAICPITEEACDKLSTSNKKKLIEDIDKDISKYDSQFEQISKDLILTKENIIKCDGELDAINKRTEKEALITSKLTTVNNNLDQVKIAKDNLPKIKIKYRTKVDELTISKENLEKRITELSDSIIKLESKKLVIEQTITVDYATELVTVDRQIKAIKKDTEEIIEMKSELSVELGSLKSKLEQVVTAIEDAKTIQAEVDVLRDDLRVYTELSFSFGKNGIQKDIINDNVPLLENKTNELLSKFAENSQLQVKFDLDPVTKSGKLKKQGGLDIVIFQKGHQPRLLNMYSGGETVRIVFAILLALSYLLTKRAGKRSQTLIIDERIAALDQDGINQFIEIVKYISNEYKKIIIVSHISELKESFTNVINVSKHVTDGSKVEYIGS